MCLAPPVEANSESTAKRNLAINRANKRFDLFVANAFLRVAYGKQIRNFSLRALLCFFLYPWSSANGQEFEIGTSPNPVGSGARAMGMGNAFIAIADDATAASWNPGGLSRLEKPELSFAGEVISLRESLSASLNSEGQNTQTLELADLNYASILFPFYLKTNMAISLNFLKLFRFDKSLQFPITFPADGPGDIERRFDTDLEQKGTFSVLAPAYGINLTQRLSLGVTWNILNDTITQASAFEKKQTTNTTVTFGNLISRSNREETNRFEVEDGDSYVIGGAYRFNKFWNLGIVIKPSYTLDVKHTRFIINRQDDPEGNNRTEDPPLDSEFDFPAILGAGISWRPKDTLIVSSDVTWTDWSDFTFKEKNKKTNPISSRPVNEGKLDDTVTIRAGCEVLLIRDNHIIPFRFGFGYDPAPAIDNVDDFYTVNMGTGIQFLEHLNLDIAYEFRWGNNVNSDTFQGFDASEDIRQHRVLASMIYYF